MTAVWSNGLHADNEPVSAPWLHRAALAVLGVVALLAGTAASSHAQPPPGSAGCPLFPPDDVWHADVSSLPVHPRSGAWLANMGGPERRLHPDFGPSGAAMPYGIPYTVVNSRHPQVHVQFDYEDESDAGPYPFGSDTPIEGGSDRHALMLDAERCMLFELYAAEYQASGSTAGSGAVWNLRSHALRPAGWTSADAAGLPILPGLLRKDEVAAGNVDHAIRITAQRTDRSYVWPARHQAGAANDPNLPPMGARFRLRASFDISRFRPDTQVVLRAMQRHGVILADNGSNWYFTGTAEDGWDTRMLDELKSVPAGAFVAIDASSLMVEPNSGQVRGGAVTPTPAAAPVSPRRPVAVPATTAAPPPATTTTSSDPTATTSTTFEDGDDLAAPDRRPAVPAGRGDNGPARWLPVLGGAAWLAVALATLRRWRAG
jgi:hypothetical protein